MNDIPGLCLLTDFITREEEELAESVVHKYDKRAWMEPGGAEMGLAVQPHQKDCFARGVYFYDVQKNLNFLAPKIDKLDNIPAFHEYRSVQFNKYERGGYIPAHVDIEEVGPFVVNLSLLSDCDMALSKDDGANKVTVRLPRRSLLILTGEARYEWTHEILPCPAPRILVAFRMA